MADSSRRQILVVEDDAFTRRVMAELLGIEGYVVRSAANGREALAVLGEAPPADLILLDLVTPVMDGWEFCRRRSQDPRLATIPVLVISGAGKTLAPDALPLEVAGYLPKPINLEALLEVIRGCW